MSTSGTPPQDTNALRRALAAIQDLRARLEVAEHASHEPIAIVGLGCRMPGSAVDPEAFWDMLRRGETAIGEVPAERWDVDQFYDPDPDRPGKMYVRHGGYMRDIDRFDPRFFEISPREARSMDPQHRLLLEVSWEALERAAINPLTLKGRGVGVFIGMPGTADYSILMLGSETGKGNPFAASGTSASIAAGRVSYFLGTHGPAVSIDTACSSSLVAVHSAMQSLRRRECELALAGGVMAALSPHVFIALCQARMLSPEGKCRSFDAAADGYVRGEGCGMLVLKRLADAEAAGDHIVAVLRGSALNQDGRSSGLTAPNGVAQEALLRAALEDARVAPDELGYLEAHGTGTRLGDPIELRAIQAVFEGRRPGNTLLVGSVKTNVGHLEAAAGIAGMLKAIAALEHEAIPASLNLETPNPAIDWAQGTLRVPTTLTPWPRDGQPRVAGVSSFGYSGTNAHVIIGEAPPAPTDRGTDRGRSLLTLSARSFDALRASAANLEAHLAAHPQPLADVCYTLNTGRAGFEHRAAIVAGSLEEARMRLRELAAGTTTNVPARSGVAAEKPRVAFLYTGQGSQYAGMGRQLFDSSPVFRAALLECDAALPPIEGRRLLEWLYDTSPEGEARLNTTGYAQPAIFCIEYALTRLWLSWGFTPVAVLGHSVGEFAAACAAGVMSLADGLTLISARARLMQALPAGGGMLAVVATQAAVQKDLDEAAGRVAVAAINGPQDIVLSGELEVLQMLAARFEARGLTARPLKVSHAFHSRLIAPMVEQFRAVAASITYRSPHWRLISNLTAQPLGDTRIDADYWCRHLLAPVLFGPSMQTLRALKIDVFLEIGPHPVLVGMASKDDPDGSSAWATSLRRGRDDWSTMLAALGELYLRGASFDARAVELPAKPRKLVLPTYPFERTRYWMDPPKFMTSLPESAVRSAATGEVVLEVDLSMLEMPWTKDFRVQGRATLPAAGYVALILEAHQRAIGGNAPRITALEIDVPFAPVPADAGRVQVSLRPEGTGLRCQVAVRSSEARDAWMVLARARLGVADEPAAASAPATGAVPDFALQAPRGGTLAAIIDAAVWRPVEAAHEGKVVAHAATLYVAPDIVGAGSLVGHMQRHAGATDITVHDAQGTLLLQATGVVLRHTTSGETARTLRLDHPLIYQLAWHAARLPERRPVHGHWLVCADAGGVAQALAARLHEAGATTALLYARDVPAAQRTAAALHARLRGAAGVVYLWGLDADNLAADVPSATRAAAADALALLQAATQDAQATPVIIATCAVTGVAAGETAGITQAPLWGLGRVVKAENADLRLQLVDLDAGADAATAAAQLADEIAANDPQDWQVAYRNGRRAIRLASAVMPPPRAALAFDPDATYLVTGGLGGVGLRAAEWMATQGARHLVLVGRSPPSAEAIAGMARIEATGATAYAARADAAQRAQLAAVLAGIPATRPLRGILHAAGVLDDGLARDLTVERLTRVLAPKVDGAWHLHELSRDAPLDFFVMFASSAGLFGSPGQANYAAANTFLDTLAHARRAQGLPGTSIDWGPWGEVGMAARLGARDQERLGSGGVSPLGVSEGLEAMGQAMLAGQPQFVGMDIDWVKTWKTLGDARPAFLHGFAPRSRPGTGAASAQAATLAAGTALRDLPPAERLPLLLAQVREQLRAVLAVDAGYVLPDDQSFVELGMDSLVAVELSNRLKPLAGKPLGATVAFDHPTVTRMAAHLNSLLHGESSPQPSAGSAAPDAPAREESWVL